MEENNLKFREPYLIAASKRLDGTVGSQFFITTDSLPFLNKKYTIFGKISNNTELVDLINVCGSEYCSESAPLKEVRIKRSGIYKPKPSSKTAAELTDFKPDINKRNQ
mmetsp:Transcript_25448/g.22619  ORF Transcript_25448/g.22619 Transcript_25448/m.22619 type:complete len:108 (-) Transcript_25448:19-342(-)